MSEPWNDGVRGSQVPPLINLDVEIMRCVAGPGSGKTFGLVRRVERLLHPLGLAVSGKEVLVVAFNRVIARQLQADIDKRLKAFDYTYQPVIRTIHALCVEVIGEDLRLLLPHEVDCLIYDVLHEYAPISECYENDFEKTSQALRDHEASLKEHLLLWQAVQSWLLRHKAHLVSEVPRIFLDRLKGGDFPEHGYSHVIVDEFQDLTPGEQELMFRLRRPGGRLLALGDPRQSIYAFRGNDRNGLAALEAIVGGKAVTDVPITECQRCPESIVIAANRLMTLSGVEEMVPVSHETANIHVVTWKTPLAEAEGMAAKIVKNIHAHPKDRHLVMVTRRDFGYWLRDKIKSIDSELSVELGFSEGLLESWAPREAFLLFCLLVDPDPPTWRAWLGYVNSNTGEDFIAAKRSAAAYLTLLKGAADTITESTIEALASEPRAKLRGLGGTAIWDRATRFLTLRDKLSWIGDDAESFIKNLFDEKHWIGSTYNAEKIDGAKLDLRLLCEKTLALLKHEEDRKPGDPAGQHARKVAQRLRHQIATNEPLDIGEPSDLQVSTLWGAKGVTAEHVYILGVCREALPGQRRKDYPGTDLDYVDEQRRLFYVSITRAKKTLVISRALGIKRGAARHLGLSVASGGNFWAVLKMSPFLHDIMGVLPTAVSGESWDGCV
jgi:ATP-dependent DNA helicase UvrD/PcrA